MSDSKEKALRLHEAGCNCSQAVVCAFCDRYGVEEATAMRMAAAFGGGMRKGEVCGAVAGALMVLGMKHGAASPGEADRKAEANAKTKEFMEGFKQRHGSYLCRELLRAAGQKICPQVIAGAVEMLDEFGC